MIVVPIKGPFTYHAIGLGVGGGKPNDHTRSWGEEGESLNPLKIDHGQRGAKLIMVRGGEGGGELSK